MCSLASCGRSVATALLLSLPAYAEPAAALVEAAAQNDRPAVVRLLAAGGDVNAARADGTTLLHWACFHDNAELAQQLIAQGANVQAQNRYGVPALSLACQNGNQRIVELLLAAGADPNLPLKGGETPLMTAARTGRVGAVQALLEAGADVNAEERRGQTAIMWAAAEGHDDVVQALLDADADFRKSLRSGFDPLFFAVRQGHGAVVQRLLDAGVDVNQVMKAPRRAGKGPARGTTPLLLAVENGHFDLAVFLLDTGANPNHLGTGFTPLHAVTWVRKPVRGDGDPSPIGSGTLSSLEFVRRLVAYGADVNARHGKRKPATGQLNKTEATPFLLAAESGDLPLLKLLVELGADPQLTNADGCTPLLAAAGVGALSNGDESAGTEEDAMAAIEYLIELGADVNAVDNNNQAAMHGAAYKSWTKLVTFLAEHGADIDVWHRTSQLGWTPLMIAQGNRPGNFRPHPPTIEAIARLMRAAGLEIPPAKRIPVEIY